MLPPVFCSRHGEKSQSKAAHRQNIACARDRAFLLSVSSSRYKNNVIFLRENKEEQEPLIWKDPTPWRGRRERELLGKKNARLFKFQFFLERNRDRQRQRQRPTRRKKRIEPYLVQNRVVCVRFSRAYVSEARFGNGDYYKQTVSFFFLKSGRREIGKKSTHARSRENNTVIIIIFDCTTRKRVKS